MLKYIITGSILTCFLNAKSQSLNNNNYKQSAAAEIGYMDSSLSLNRMQHDSVSAYVTEYYKNIAGLNETVGTAEERAGKIKTIRAGYQTKMQKVLTIAQWKKYTGQIEAIKQEMQAQNKNGNHQ
ncbi:hypothetical protein ACI6Q2_22500 [Chitinophagaceae bacterium LWZ2-11]